MASTASVKPLMTTNNTINNKQIIVNKYNENMHFGRHNLPESGVHEAKTKRFFFFRGAGVVFVCIFW